MSKREKYINKIAEKLKKWDARIEELENKAEKAKDEVKDEYHEKIEELKKKQSKARQNLEKIRNASDAAWQEMKEGLDTSLKILNKSVKDAFKKFK